MNASLAALTTLALTAGCATRTVYVVADNNLPPRPAPVAVADRRDVRPQPAPAPIVDDGPADYADANEFYEPLSPYGRWVDYPGYGLVFVPDRGIVGAGFRPYTYGHWEYSEWGWTWVDHHPFGWATGHYGRWFYDSSYGWAWVPGTTWSPAWVTWRGGGGYVGWAAMPPGAVYGVDYAVYDTSWCFVETRYVGVGYVGTYIVVGSGYRTVYATTYPSRETTVVYGRTTYRGPREDEVTRAGATVVHRPAREIDNERATTRAPRGSSGSRDRKNNGSSRARGEERDAQGRASAESRGTSDQQGTSDQRGASDARGDSRSGNPAPLPPAGTGGEAGSSGDGEAGRDSARDTTPTTTAQDANDGRTAPKSADRPSDRREEQPRKAERPSDPFGVDRGSSKPAPSRPDVGRAPTAPRRDVDRAPPARAPDRVTPAPSRQPAPAQPSEDPKKKKKAEKPRSKATPKR